MNTTIKALQALYVKLGGNLTDTYSDIAGGIAVGNYVLIPDMIKACSKKAGSGGGGSDLPAVTSEDNGDVLTVVEGEWSKGNAPVFAVNFTDGAEAGEVVSTATISEINAAFEAGRVIVGNYDGSGVTMLLSLGGIGENLAEFTAIFNDGDNVELYTVLGSINDETESWTLIVDRLTKAST